MTWLRRLFRRDPPVRHVLVEDVASPTARPPHLRGRVPVDCGAGETTLRMFDDFGPVGWSPPLDAVGRAFLKSALPTALGRAVQKAQAACSRRERVVSVTPEEYEAACRMESTAWRFVPDLGDTLTLYGVRLEVLPTPAENARRYTSEEETW